MPYTTTMLVQLRLLTGVVLNDDEGWGHSYPPPGVMVIIQEGMAQLEVGINRRRGWAPATAAVLFSFASRSYRS
jgi:hypothetical protein